MQLLLSTLGALQAATTDEQGIERTLGRGKPVAMLAYLACVPGHRASREHLAALLWGDVESEAARQNVRQTIWYLKKKLGDGLLDVTGEMLALMAPCTCDRDEFMGAARRADFAAAVKLYTGPFIPDFAAPGASEFEQWCELERRRVMVTFLRCADALARQWLGEGKFRDAQDLARRARDVDPMDQATWRLLLESLIAGSDSLGAASEAEHFETFLAREEQEPDAASRAALRAARRATVAPLPGDSRLSASIASELVGRESQFSHVLAAWEQARAGSPRVLVVTAAAGLGKSRLLRDVQARLRASRARCVLVRANPGDRHLSAGFAAEVTSQVAALPGAAAISTGSAGVLVSLAPALAATYPNAVPDSSEGEEAVRRRALAAIDLMRAVSEEQPVAILLDDLHWADEHSARVIAAALSRLEHARVLVVLTKRVMADPRAHYSGFEQLELPPLDLAAVSSFVSHVAQLPATPWADILPQQLLLATGGSPLLLVETLHDALEQGWLKCSAAGIWECEDPSRITTFLREGSAVRQRVQRLSPPARHGLLALAILGRPVRLEDARAMMGGRAVELEEPLEVLERGGFIVRHGFDLVVAHDEIADAVVEASNVEERRRIHAGIAQDLASRTEDEVALRRAAEHARAGGVDSALMQAWQAFLAARRRAGDRRSTRVLAADFLTIEPSAPEVGRLVASTPILKRQRTRWIAAAGVLFAALGALALVSRKPPPLTSDFTVWTVDSATGRGHFVGVRLPRDMRWDDNSPIEAVDLDETDFPTIPPGMKSRWVRSPNAKEWRTDVVDSVYGDETIFLDSLGRTSMPMASRGDDAIADFSPDGRVFLGVTARFDTLTDHLHLVSGNPLEGSNRRLT